MSPIAKPSTERSGRVLRLATASILISLIAAVFTPFRVAQACNQPGIPSIAASFDLAANGLLTDPALQVSPSAPVRTIPPSILKAVGWIESGWRQFTPAGRPLVSFDFGYGVMQITSGMAGAFGSGSGTLDPETQSRIASDVRFNIGYGARMLISKFAGVPRIGSGDPTAVESWYYALWAYNGWGWVNNPSNPRFTRQGTPATHPSTYPYQERVLYLVAHPPHDADGNPLWQPVPDWMPSPALIGKTAHTYTPASLHRQPPPAFEAGFTVSGLDPTIPGTTSQTSVRVQNTGTQAWPASGAAAISLTYHLFMSTGNPWGAFSPFTPGVVALGQSAVPLPHDVLPRQSVTLKATVRAPDSAGRYLVVWDLQQAPAIWLSQLGLWPRAQKLRVLSADTPVAGRTPTPAPTPRLVPTEGVLYVADTAVPDGTTVQPRTHFQKSWLVFNNGRVAWASGWTLHHVSGPAFGAKLVPVPPLSACRSGNLTVAMKAPSKPGSYTGVWRLGDSSGHDVGDKLTVVIIVKGAPPAHTPVPSPTPTATTVRLHPNPTATATPTG